MKNRTENLTCRKRKILQICLGMIAIALLITLAILYYAHSRNIEHLVAEGDRAYEEKNYEKAISYYQEAVEIRPNDHRAHVFLAQAFFGAGRYEEALEYCEKALEIDPEDVRMHANMAFILKELGRHEAAQKHYKKVYELMKSSQPSR